NHMDTYQVLNLLRRDAGQNPVSDWNMVFIPYCTGDIHTGNKVATYANPAGGDPLVFRHVGHDDVMKSLTWIAGQFTHVPKLLVTGCSAPMPPALQPVTRSLGTWVNWPAMHSDGPSHQLHETIRAA